MLSVQDNIFFVKNELCHAIQDMYCEVPWPLPEMTSILVVCIKLVVTESLVPDGIPKDVNVFKKHISIQLYSEADILSKQKAHR